MRSDDSWLTRTATLLRTALLLLLIPTLLTGCDRVKGLIGTTPEQARVLAKTAYIEGYPLVLTYGAMYRKHIDTNSGQYLGPLNQLISQTSLYTATSTGVVNPNNDVLVSTLQLDLRAEPIVLCMPTMASERYYSVQFIDMNMFDFGSVDQRKTSNTAGCVLVSGPRFNGVIPSGVRQVLRSSTDFATALYRTQVADATDLDLATQIQSAYTLQPLSSFVANGTQTPAEVKQVAWRPYTDAAMTTEFVPMFDYLLQFALSDNVKNLEDLGKIGIGPKARKPYAALSAEMKAAIDAGIADGRAAIDARAKQLDTKVNGWQVSAPYTSRGGYKGDDLLRAAAAQRSPFAPDARDAIFILVRTDARGAALDGTVRGYKLVFPAGNLPPVRGFWSISLYDARTHGFVANPYDRYLVNALTARRMDYAADGSLTLHLQAAAPAADQQANWLPTPSGPFELVLRMYMPGTDRLSILPPGRGTWKPPAIEPVS